MFHVHCNVITCHFNFFATIKSTHSTVLWESMSLFGKFSTALITTFSFPPAQSSCSTVGRRERRNGPKYKSQHQAEKLKKKTPGEQGKTLFSVFLIQRLGFRYCTLYSIYRRSQSTAPTSICKRPYTALKYIASLIALF